MDRILIGFRHSEEEGSDHNMKKAVQTSIENFNFYPISPFYSHHLSSSKWFQLIKYLLITFQDIDMFLFVATKNKPCMMGIITNPFKKCPKKWFCSFFTFMLKFIHFFNHNFFRVFWPLMYISIQFIMR